ncbi:MAG TPA: hypothetical protein PLN89_05100 [Elusimicrobiota bacterium]|nr:hypothetical protein [Elusimicrobiota bacterium]HNF58932.1 hypothetical protein [Elusimicrobiota bacterium]
MTVRRPDRECSTRGTALLPVMLIFIILLPLILLLVKKMILHNTFSFRDRAYRGSRGLASNALTDYMRQFSEDYRADFYQDYKLRRNWNYSSLSYSGVGLSSTTYNYRIDPVALSTSEVRKNRVFVFRNIGYFQNREELKKSQGGAIQFKSDLARFELIAFNSLTINTNDPLDGRTLESVWIRGNLSFPSPVDFKINGPYAFSQFVTSGVIVVNGNISDSRLKMDNNARVYHSGAANFDAGFTPSANENINYIPPELTPGKLPPTGGMAFVDPFQDLTYYQSHFATSTVVPATITFTNTGVDINSGAGNVPFAIDATQGATILGNGAPLYIQNGTGIYRKVLIVTVGGSSVTVNGPLAYHSNATKSSSGEVLAVLSDGDLVFKGNNDHNVVGLYYVSDALRVIDAGNKVTARGSVILGIAHAGITTSDNSEFDIKIDTGLRSNLPAGLPEQPSLADLRVTN